MRGLFKKLNFWHCLILLALPIILALINSNWIFNNFIIDDYIYLGFQLDLPNYATWEPASSYYFIDRISWFAPTYVIRQVLSPLMANFVIHLAVYYLAVFSVYGIMNRLFHARVALFTSILMGTFSLFLRAVGWDYVDGYSLALLALCACLLTYAATSPHSRRYLIGAGAIASIMVVAQIFNSLYCIALALYYFWLNHHHHRHSLIHTAIYAGLSAIIVFGVQSIIFYAVTGRWFIWENTFRISDGGRVIRSWSQLVSSSYSSTVSTWHILFFSVTITAFWSLAFPKRFQRTYIESTTHFNPHFKAVFIFFVGVYGILWSWFIIFNYEIFRLSFYSSIVIPSVFMMLGALVASELYRLYQKQFMTVISLSLIIPITFFIGFNFLSLMQLGMLFIIAMLLGIIFFVLSFTTKHPKRLINLIASATLLSFLTWIDPFYVGVFNTDRTANQEIYEIVIDATDIIKARYDDYELDTFRFWYSLKDDNVRVISSLTSIYMHQWTRRIYTMNDRVENTNPVWDENLYRTKEIILLSTELDTQGILDMGNVILNPIGYELQFMDDASITKGDITLAMVFTQVVPIES